MTTAKKTATKTAAKATEKKTTAKASEKKAEKKTVVKKTAKTTKKVSSQKTYSEAVQAAAKILFELRAQKLQLIDLRGISETSDFMLLATCESEAIKISNTKSYSTAPSTSPASICAGRFSTPGSI